MLSHISADIQKAMLLFISKHMPDWCNDDSLSNALLRRTWPPWRDRWGGGGRGSREDISWTIYQVFTPRFQCLGSNVGLARFFWENTGGSKMIDGVCLPLSFPHKFDSNGSQWEERWRKEDKGWESRWSWTLKRRKEKDREVKVIWGKRGLL